MQTYFDNLAYYYLVYSLSHTKKSQNFNLYILLHKISPYKTL